MVHTELSYNPYLLETIVSFNGQAPRINSQIEKYQDGRIQEWLKKLPEVFHDEMNGYGFQFIYSGTVMDFESIKKAFKNAGVQDHQIDFVFKNELESPAEKYQRIYKLLSWLEEKRNRRFDFDSFKDTSGEVFETPNSFITLYAGNSNSVVLSKVSIKTENIENVEELESTDVKDVPIVMFIDSQNLEVCRKSVQYLKNIKGIQDRQLFFVVSIGLNKLQIERTLKDLGVKEPTIISELNDNSLEEYFAIFPLTNYVKRFIETFRELTATMQAALDEENEVSKVQNAEIYAKIEKLEDDIKNLKNADIKFTQKDNLQMPSGFSAASEQLNSKILKWRKSKTKTNSYETAQDMAEEFDDKFKNFFSEFYYSVTNDANKLKDNIDSLFKTWYRDANVDVEHVCEESFTTSGYEYSLPMLREEFLNLRTERYVEQKEGFFDLFKNPSDKTVKNLVLETTFAYEEWRQLASKTYLELARNIISDRESELLKYYDKLAERYHKHIDDLISDTSDEKNVVAERLSEDERLLQLDNDWLEELKDQLHLIERG